MTNPRFSATLAAICLLEIASLVAAATFPGGGGGGGGGRPGVPIAAAVTNRNSSYGDYGGVTFSYNLGGGPTGIGMQPSAPPISRPQPPQSFAPPPDQAQASRDWWFQNQGQQMAQQRAQGYGAISVGRGAMSVGYGIEAAAPLPQAAMDIIKWPLLLQRPTFASRRAQIEAPYRRSPPGLSLPTADDYRTIVTVAEEMKAMLEGLLQEGSLPTNQLDEAENFLNRIQQDARGRAQRADARPRTPKS
jgi:hypothetical protein